MKGDPLPETDHIVRYVKPTSFEDGLVDGGGFELKEGHAGISVNWLDYFDGIKETQLAEVRNLKRLEWSKNGCLAELNVGEVKRALREEVPNISIVKDELPADPVSGHASDPSHSLICGIPVDPPERKQALQDMIAECVLRTHPTTV